ncbi:hypothetical protein AOQ84DRAFT_230451, partial [Glonium stellatum]
VFGLSQAQRGRKFRVIPKKHTVADPPLRDSKYGLYPTSGAAGRPQLRAVLAARFACRCPDLGSATVDLSPTVNPVTNQKRPGLATAITIREPLRGPLKPSHTPNHTVYRPHVLNVLKRLVTSYEALFRS